jgi:hypothetical protein
VTALKLYHGVMLAITAATKIWAVAQAALNLVMAANPIGLVVIAVGALVAALVWFFTQTEIGRTIFGAFVETLRVQWSFLQGLFMAGVTYVAGLWQSFWQAGILQNAISALASIQSAVQSGLAIVGQIVRVAMAIVSAIFTGDWSKVQGIVLGAAAAIQGHVSSMVGSVRSAIGSVGAAISGIQGFVTSAVAGAGQWLVSSGRSLIQGFINGIRDMAGSVGRAVSSVVSSALDFFPNSPAKKGPLRGPGWRKLRRSGQAVTNQFSDGFDPDVFDFRGGFPGDPGPSSGGGDTGGAGGGGGIQVIFNGPVTTQDVPELIKAQRREATRARKAALGGARRVRVAA